MNGTPLSTDFRLLNTDSALIDRLIISPSLVLSAIHVVHSVVYVNSVSHCISFCPVAISLHFCITSGCLVQVSFDVIPRRSFHFTSYGAICALGISGRAGKLAVGLGLLDCHVFRVSRLLFTVAEHRCYYYYMYMCLMFCYVH